MYRRLLQRQLLLRRRLQLDLPSLLERTHWARERNLWSKNQRRDQGLPTQRADSVCGGSNGSQELRYVRYDLRVCSESNPRVQERHLRLQVPRSQVHPDLFAIVPQDRMFAVGFRSSQQP